MQTRLLFATFPGWGGGEGEVFNDETGVGERERERASTATLTLTLITSFPVWDFKSKGHCYTLCTIPSRRVITYQDLTFFLEILFLAGFQRCYLPGIKRL